MRDRTHRDPSEAHSLQAARRGTRSVAGKSALVFWIGEVPVSSARFILPALLAAVVVGGCADTEKMRYIDNPRLIGNATQTEVAELARTTGAVSAWAGLEFLRAWLGGDDRD